MKPKQSKYHVFMVMTGDEDSCWIEVMWLVPISVTEEMLLEDWREYKRTVLHSKSAGVGSVKFYEFMEAKGYPAVNWTEL